MNIALLFNSDDPKYDGFYGPPIRNTIFGVNIIQTSNRHMKISVGDVLIYAAAKTWNEYDEITKWTYFSGTWSLLLESRLRETFRKSTVYALTFENMTKDIAQNLHNALQIDSAYLGLMEVDYTHPPHLALFRNSMITLYRVQGTTCNIFYSMGEEDSKDFSEIGEAKKLGFRNVDWEDRGAHGTIFDDFDNLSHFSRVAQFRDTITPFMKGGDDEAAELVMVLEDLNPRLFNVLGAAVSALNRAENEEDIAQVALSGRRYLERLSEAIFPPQDDLYNGRKVGREQYRNRIWAFIADNTSNNPDQLVILGAEVDRLDKEFNAGLHADREKERILQALSDTASLTAALLALNPSKARKPYLAHEKRMIEFFREALSPETKDPTE